MRNLLNSLPHAPGEYVYEVQHQLPYIIAAFPQGRHLHWKDVQPIVKVTAEFVSRDHLGQVAMSGRHQANVDTLCTVAAIANAQNSAMTYALDAAFARAVNDNEVAVLVLAGQGKHFCAGHDIGTPERDADTSFDREAVLWWDHVGKEGADARYAREMEVYLGMCRRWRSPSRPSRWCTAPASPAG